VIFLNISWWSVAAAGLIVIMVAGGIFAPPNYLPYTWIGEFFALLILLIIVGKATPIKDGSIKDPCDNSKKWYRFFIDERNQMSLSRFQLVMWTLVVISAYFTMVLYNLHTSNILDAMVIAVPSELWTVLGISVTALVGTNLILGGKKDQIPKDDYGIKTADEKEGNEDNKGLVREGVVCKNDFECQAKFTDIFTGDELAECSNVNLAKVQMFFFTIIILIGYSALLLYIMSSASSQTPFAAINTFPEISQDLAILLAISNGGYLLQKAAPSTPTA
jgi:hypothetical protein